MVAFKVMTWNVENLFAPGDPSGPNTPAAFQQKIERLAEVITNLNPDVLALQEMGGPEPFAALVAALGDRYPQQQLSTQPDGRGIRVGFLSKLTIQDSSEQVNFPTAGLPTVPGLDRAGNLINETRTSRGTLRIRVQLESGLTVHLITAHFKSKLLTFPSTGDRPRFATRDEDERARVAGIALLRRTAEAVALRVQANDILQQNPDDALIVLGDLNDVTDAATTQILQGPSGSQIGTRGFNPPDQGDPARLFNLAPLIPEARRFSRIFRGQGELIDHILASVELFPGQPRQLPDVDSHIDQLDPLPSIDENPLNRRGDPVSDHAPITARFDV